MTSIALAIEHPQILRLLMPQRQGAGVDLLKVEERTEEIRNDYCNSPAITDRTRIVATAFHEYAEAWREAIRFQSSLTRIAEVPAYRAIISLGEEVVPLLLHELQERPEQWFAALREITGDNPVAPADRGRIRAMTAAWLRWGRERGLIT